MYSSISVCGEQEHELRQVSVSFLHGGVLPFIGAASLSPTEKVFETRQEISGEGGRKKGRSGR
jgi:hypothetical protein